MLTYMVTALQVRQRPPDCPPWRPFLRRLAGDSPDRRPDEPDGSDRIPLRPGHQAPSRVLGRAQADAEGVGAASLGRDRDLVAGSTCGEDGQARSLHGGGFGSPSRSPDSLAGSPLERIDRFARIAANLSATRPAAASHSASFSSPPLGRLDAIPRRVEELAAAWVRRHFD